MSILIAATIGILVAVAILHLLQRDGVRMVIGLYIGWNALNLFILAMAQPRGVRAPVIGHGSGPMADALVQALVLTAIVITFGFTFFLVTLVFWLSRHKGSIDVYDFQEGKR